MSPRPPWRARSGWRALVTGLACLSALGVGVGARAEPAAAVSPGGPGVTYLCGESRGFDCMPGTGYEGQSVWGSYGPGHNCVSYAAFRLQQNGAERPWPDNLGNGSVWDDKARAVGIRVDTTPAVGSIAQWDGGSGHVAYVEAVDDEAIIITEDAYAGFSAMRRIERTSPTFAEAEFIHVLDRTGTTADILLYAPGPDADAVAWGGLGSRTPMPGAFSLRGTYQVLPGDFDADGTGDLLLDGAGGRSDHVLWGRAGSQSPEPAPVRPGPMAADLDATVGDLDGDGADDVLWLAPDGSGTTWWGTPGDRRFTPADHGLLPASTVAAGDLDGDGVDDVALLGPGRNRVVWGASGVRTLRAGPLPMNDAGAAVAADVDGDGLDDLVVHGPGEDAIWWSTAGREAPTRTAVTIPDGARVAGGDLDGDGIDELVLHRPGDAPDAIWWGQTQRGLPLATELALPGDGWPVVADLDGR